MKTGWKIPGWWWLLPVFLVLSVLVQAAGLFLSNAGRDAASGLEFTDSPYKADQWPRVFPGAFQAFVTTKEGQGYQIQYNDRTPQVEPVSSLFTELGPLAAVTEATALTQAGTAWAGMFGLYSSDESPMEIPVPNVVQVNDDYSRLVLTADGTVYDGAGNRVNVPEKIVDLRSGAMVTESGNMYRLAEYESLDTVKVPGVTDARLGCQLAGEDFIVVSKDGEVYRWRNYGVQGDLHREDLPTTAPIVQLSCLQYDDGAVFYSAVDAKGSGYHGWTRSDAIAGTSPDQGGYDPQKTEWIKFEGVTGATSSATTLDTVVFVTGEDVVLCPRTDLSGQPKSECDPERITLQ